MNRIVYFLGAGFSAPFGLPVMSNFLIKSKDMFFSDPEHYNHFQRVFDNINKLSVSKNYFDADLFNIEEILSILDMESFIDKRRKKESFLEYISDVIEYFTPKLASPQGNNIPSNWPSVIFGKNSNQNLTHLGAFVSEIFNVEMSFNRDISPRIRIGRQEKRQNLYSIISLNYDLIIENMIDFLNGDDVSPANSPLLDLATRESDLWETPTLAKLHGCVKKGGIVPPTWNKGNNSEISKIWNQAYHLLSNATHIRFIGYSLPPSDAYVKYLLKAAVLKAQHLKSIDVICLDPDGIIKARYDEFIKFNYYRFQNADTKQYLLNIYNLNVKPIESPNRLVFNNLEKAHELIF